MIISVFFILKKTVIAKSTIKHKIKDNIIFLKDILSTLFLKTPKYF